MEQDMETVVHDGWNTAVDRYIGIGDICRTGNRMSDRREWQGFDQRRDRTAAGRMVLYRGEKRQRAPA